MDFKNTIMKSRRSLPGVSLILLLRRLPRVPLPKPWLFPRQIACIRPVVHRLFGLLHLPDHTNYIGKWSDNWYLHIFPRPFFLSDHRDCVPSGSTGHLPFHPCWRRQRDSRSPGRHRRSPRKNLPDSILRSDRPWPAWPHPVPLHRSYPGPRPGGPGLNTFHWQTNPWPFAACSQVLP